MIEVKVQGPSRSWKVTTVTTAHGQWFALAFVRSCDSVGLGLYHRDRGEVVQDTTEMGAYRRMGTNFSSKPASVAAPRGQMDIIFTEVAPGTPRCA